MARSGSLPSLTRVGKGGSRRKGGGSQEKKRKREGRGKDLAKNVRMRKRYYRQLLSIFAFRPVIMGKRNHSFTATEGERYLSLEMMDRRQGYSRSCGFPIAVGRNLLVIERLCPLLRRVDPSANELQFVWEKKRRMKPKSEAMLRKENNRGVRQNLLLLR